jgi:hypothetical protein
MANLPEDSLAWNPTIFKDPWVELSALLEDSPEQRTEVIGVALQLQKEVLTAQIKAVEALQSVAAKLQR